MVQGAFAKLRFQGDRFTGPVFPVEALPELSTYRDLVLEAAKALWYADNTHRTNAPRGFESAFGLLLVAIEDGSSMPVLARTAVLATAIQGMTPDEAAHYFDAGRALVAQVVDHAARKADLPDVVTPRLGQRFAAFGSKLHPDERVLLVNPADGTIEGPAFNHETRDWIIERIPSEYSEDVELLGEIVRADKLKHVFEVRGFEGGRPLPFEANPAISAQLLTWMRDDTIVRVKGKATHRTIGGFHRLEVDSIEMLQQDLGDAVTAPCPLPINVQLADIARLSDGWLDGDGTAYPEFSIARAKTVFEALLKFGGIEMPYLYPSPDGSLRAEWNHPDVDVVVTLDPTGIALRLLSVDHSGERKPYRANYDADESGLRALASLLEKLLEAGGP